DAVSGDLRPDRELRGHGRSSTTPSRSSGSPRKNDLHAAHDVCHNQPGLRQARGPGELGAFESVRGFYQRAADRLGLEPPLSEIMARPEQELSVQIRVPMDDGTIALYQGYRVQQWRPGP